jgi:hypothetical protein
MLHIKLVKVTYWKFITRFINERSYFKNCKWTDTTTNAQYCHCTHRDKFCVLLYIMLLTLRCNYLASTWLRNISGSCSTRPLWRQGGSRDWHLGVLATPLSFVPGSRGRPAFTSLASKLVQRERSWGADAFVSSSIKQIHKEHWWCANTVVIKYSS